MKRRRDDSVKDGCGVDGSLGQKFTRQNRDDPWNPPKLGTINPRGAGVYTSDDAGLRNKRPDEATAKSRDVWDAVEGQSSDSGNRAVRSRD